MKKAGSFLISLDFELMWGMFDKTTIEQYGANLRGVWEVVPRLLKLFERYDIHATWATVGMLMCESKSDLSTARPAVTPRYARLELSAYEHMATAAIDETDPCYFAPQLVRQIIETPGQELASHTFSHFYCREAQVGGQGEALAADCAAFAAIAARFHKTPTSIVFPRNQWDQAALAVFAEYGFTAFRGTEQHFLYRARPDAAQNNLVIRALRLLDHYLNLSGHHTYQVFSANLGNGSGVVNLPASRFLRPYSKRLAPFEPLRRRRIKQAMTLAARRGEVFHLWWHPHNFGVNQEQNFNFLEALLEHFAHLRQTEGMESHSMGELATHARAARGGATMAKTGRSSPRSD